VDGALIAHRTVRCVNPPRAGELRSDEPRTEDLPICPSANRETSALSRVDIRQLALALIAEWDARNSERTAGPAVHSISRGDRESPAVGCSAPGQATQRLFQRSGKA
jgi:hypothetical protein